MEKISSFLQKFRNLIKSDNEFKATVSSIIKNNTNIEIKTQDIEIKNGGIHLKAKPLVKNEIFMKREKILLDINTGPGNRKIREIY